jgi:hypothetical protein
VQRSLPTRIRRSLRRRYRRRIQATPFRLATERWRLQPTFLVIGAAKSGTTSLCSYLGDHPSVLWARTKEVVYFSREYHRGPKWYRAQFPLRARARGVEGPQVGDGSPGYLFFPHAARRAYELDPALKLVALLRDPVERAYSHHQMRKRNHPGTPPTFEAHLERELETLPRLLEEVEADPDALWSQALADSCLFRGRYMEQLDRWLELFPRDQLLVLATEDLDRDPEAAVDEVLGFLGLPPAPRRDYPRLYVREYEPMKPETRKWLAGYYAEENRRLYELLGRDLGWARPQTAATGRGARTL